MSLFKCLEQVNIIANNPIDKGIICADFNLVSYWIIDNLKSDKKLLLKINLLDPNNNLINSTMQNIEIKKEWKRIRNIANIKQICVKCEGRYIFEILQQEKGDFKPVARIPLDIRMINKNNKED